MSLELLRVRVPDDAKVTTVGRYLEGPLKLSGGLVRKLKMSGGIRVNDQVVKTNFRLKPGDEIQLVLTRHDAQNVTPEAMDLDVVYEDDDVVVLSKAAGIVVHPTHGVYSGTLANGLAARFIARGEPSAIHPIHRLDRDTSGLVLFARHSLAHQRLAEQLLAHDLERSYLALARGQVSQDSGTVDAPIGLRGDHPTARAVREDGQQAITHFEVLKRSPQATLLRLRLATGRTHQIRVHMSHLGHPLLGDDLYGEERNEKKPRQALHAATLGFKHPRTGAWMLFESPLPEDLRLVVANVEL